MSWRNYYRILKNTGGDLSKADPKEMIEASRANPDNQTDALNVARRKYAEDPNENYWVPWRKRNISLRVQEEDKFVVGIKKNNRIYI